MKRNAISRKWTRFFDTGPIFQTTRVKRAFIESENDLIFEVTYRSRIESNGLCYLSVEPAQAHWYAVSLTTSIPEPERSVYGQVSTDSQDGGVLDCESVFDGVTHRNRPNRPIRIK